MQCVLHLNRTDVKRKAKINFACQLQPVWQLLKYVTVKSSIKLQTLNYLQYNINELNC